MTWSTYVWRGRRTNTPGRQKERTPCRTHAGQESGARQRQSMREQPFAVFAHRVDFQARGRENKRTAWHAGSQTVLHVGTANRIRSSDAGSIIRYRSSLASGSRHLAWCKDANMYYVYHTSPAASSLSRHMRGRCRERFFGTTELRARPIVQCPCICSG